MKTAGVSGGPIKRTLIPYPFSMARWLRNREAGVMDYGALGPKSCSLSKLNLLPAGSAIAWRRFAPGFKRCASYEELSRFIYRTATRFDGQQFPRGSCLDLPGPRPQR